jgi:YrhK-like protein
VVISIIRGYEGEEFIPDIWDYENYLYIKAGRFRLYFRKRYRLITTVNDLLIGLLFVTGSCLNCASATAVYGHIFYLCGRLLLGSRPVLRIMHDISLRNEVKQKDLYNSYKKEKIIGNKIPKWILSRNSSSF